jgi:hypothetical protein
MAGRGLFVTALALMSLAAPRVVQAQVKTAPAAAKPAAAAPAAKPAAAPAAAQAQAPIDPKLVELAKLHATLNTARDDFFAKIGRTHDDEGKTNLRKEFNDKEAQIFKDHGTTQQEYQRQIFTISSDPAQRDAFERALKQVTESAAL